LPDIYTQYTDYCIFGSESKSKGHYHVAVFQICLQGPGESPPSVDNDAIWGRVSPRP
jgi:hypothetical protein